MDVDIKSARVLGQLRPTNTNAASIYKPALGILGVITGLIICNQSAAAATYRVFFDANGSTYNEDTALLYDESLNAYQSGLIEIPSPGLSIYGKDTGNLAVRSGTANSITFTVIGYEVR